MAIDQSEIKLRKDSGINLNFPEITTENQDVLIAGNTIGFFGYTQVEYPGLRNTYGDHDRYFWLIKAVKMNTNFTIMGEIEEKIYYENLFNELAKYKLNFKYTFEETFVPDDYVPALKDIMKNRKNKHFDICLMNPPYLGESRNDYNFPLKFFNKVCEISDHIITIQPIMFLYKTYERKSPEQSERIAINNVQKYECEIEEIHGKKFDAAFNNKIGIINLNKSRETDIIICNNKQYNCVKDINNFSHDNLLVELENIVRPLSIHESVFNHFTGIDKRSEKSGKDIRRKNDSKLKTPFIMVSAIRGNKGKDDVYSIIPKDRKIEYGERPYTYINFNSNKEAQGFINYAKTDFCCINLYMYKLDFNLSPNLHYVPWFDFSQDIFSKSPKEIDDYLFKKYNISDEIRKHIEEILPDYYGIRER